MGVNLQKQILERKFKFITRWIFGGLLINLQSTKCVWWQKDLHKFKIYNWELELDEANIESLQLVCSAIETYGRIMLGHGDREGVSEESFVAFITQFFPKKYQGKANEIYSHYRCGLLHSYILGYNSPKGFFPTRGNDRQYWDKHLWFTNAQNNNISKSKNASHQRLVLNINIFFKDFQKAVEKFIGLAISDKKIKKFIIKVGKNQIDKEIDINSVKQNSEQSLNDIPED